MDGQSLDIKQDHIEKLKTLFPEAITEGKVDWEKLKATLGEDISFSNERYVLNWAGKSEAFKVLQEPTTATLVPDKEESVDFDDTGHLFIEGENLEVLKVLQKSYYGKVKMIYIDPPYNTGNDHFIYPDRFSESKEEYLKRVGEKDEEGYLTREGLFRANSKDSGHYHSNWMNMMYPRLFLARNLLKDDGVIFVSIDDNEVHNLRLLMNEIFGEENFVACVVWQKRYAVAGDDDGISPMHEYVLAYRKSDRFERCLLPRTEKQLSRYKNLDNDPRGEWSSDNYVSNKSKEERPTLWYPINHPKTGKDVWPDENAVWRYSKEKHKVMVEENRLYWGPNMNYEKPRLKRFLNEIQQGVVPGTWWSFKEVGHNDEAQKETAKLFGNKKIFSTPKPVRLLQRILEIGADKDCIVCDFFAGSNVLGQAVYEMNVKDSGNRKWLCIQLPEEIDEKTEAFRNGYKNVADIGKGRCIKAKEKIENDIKENVDLFNNGETKKLDLGFKVFKLQTSNFKIWRGDKFENGEQLAKQLQAFTDPTNEGSAEENMLYELLLKSGFSLNSKIENKKHFFVINGNKMVVALTKMTEAIVKEIIAGKPEKCIALDKLFADNDQLKTNTVLQMKDAGIEFKTI